MDTDRKSLLSTLLQSEDSSEGSRSLNSISEKVIGCAFRVGNTLGCGFLEKVYDNALTIELTKAGLLAKQQQCLSVYYDGCEVGKYEADIMVENCILIELKAVRDLNDIHKAQCINYLRATGFKLCLLINFGNPRVEIKRIVL